MRKLMWILAVLAVGCMTKATAEGQAVRLTRNPQATAGCKFLGRVKVTNNIGMEQVENDMREEAAKLGANVVFAEDQPRGSYEIGGEAYRCEQPKQ